MPQPDSSLQWLTVREVHTGWSVSESSSTLQQLTMWEILPLNIETEPRDDTSEVRARMIDCLVISLAPAEERVLHDVLGVGDRAEHAVREPAKKRPVLFEFCGHAEAPRSAFTASHMSLTS